MKNKGKRKNMKEEILNRLEEHYKGARPALVYSNPYELLVATILSAQCTDVRVNKVTKELFVHYPDPESLSHADFDELSREIKSCGCYGVKAKNLIGTAKLPLGASSLTSNLLKCEKSCDSYFPNKRRKAKHIE